MSSAALKVAIETYIPSGRALLITGAGFSWGATPKAAKIIPGVEALKTILLNACSIPSSQRESFSLPTAIEAYRDKFKNEAKLASLLYSHLWAEKAAQHHEIISALPWHRVYTTNYDNVFELAARSAGVDFEVFDQSGQVKTKQAEIAQSIHLHGYIASTNPTDDVHRFIAGVASYAQPQLYESDWLRQFEKDIDSAPAIFVIGNSISDNHIARILAKRQDYFSKLYFVVEAAPPLALTFQLKPFGPIHNIGVDGFAQICSGLDLKKTRSNAPPSSLELLKFALPSRQPLSDNLDALLLQGDLDKPFLHQELHQPTPIRYFVPRIESQLLDVLIGTNGKRQKFLFLHSATGNGKSVAALELASRLTQRAVSTYILHPEKGDIGSAIRYLSELPSLSAVIVEDVFQYGDIMEELRSLNRGDLIVILTTRTAVYEVRKSKLKKQFAAGQLLELDLNRLTTPQVAKMAALLDQYGYWKDRGGLSDSQKADHIGRRCEGEMSAALISLLDSPIIKAKLSAYFDLINRLPQRVTEYMVIATYCRYISGVMHNAYAIGAIMQTDYAIEISNSSDALALELFSKDYSAHFRSAVFGIYFLQKHTDDDLAVQILQRFVVNLDRHVYERGNREFEPLLRQALRYRHVIRVLNTSRSDELADEFFDGLHGLRTAQRDPLFWIQCSIAKLAVRRFDKCENYISTARSHADRLKSSGYDPFQVDTHEATFLIESRLHGHGVDFGSALKRSAHLVEGVISRREEDLERPLEVAAGYWDFYSRFKDYIDEDVTTNVCRMLTRVRDRIMTYDNTVLKRHNIGQKALESIDKVLRVGKNYN